MSLVVQIDLHFLQTHFSKQILDIQIDERDKPILFKGSQIPKNTMLCIQNKI
jgi:hypothetical protein